MNMQDNVHLLLFGVWPLVGRNRRPIKTVGFHELRDIAERTVELFLCEQAAHLQFGGVDNLARRRSVGGAFHFNLGDKGIRRRDERNQTSPSAVDVPSTRMSAKRPVACSC